MQRRPILYDAALDQIGKSEKAHGNFLVFHMPRRVAAMQEVMPRCFDVREEGESFLKSRTLSNRFRRGGL